MAGGGQIDFKLENLDSPPDVNLAWPDGGDSPIAVPMTTDEASWLYQFAVVWGTEASIEYQPGDGDANGTIHIAADNEGADTGEIVLYEDSGFHAGYVKLWGDDLDSSMGSDVHCDMTPAAQ